MKPFVDLGLMNIHGLSNHYGNYYYKCQPRYSNYLILIILVKSMIINTYESIQ